MPLIFDLRAVSISDEGIIIRTVKAPNRAVATREFGIPDGRAEKADAAADSLAAALDSLEDAISCIEDAIC